MDKKTQKIISDFPKEVKLKDSGVVTVRGMMKTDLEKLVEFFNELPEEDKLFLKDDVTRRSTIETWLGNLDYERILPLVAEVENRIVGDASLHMHKHGWARHVGEIRVVVAKDYQRRGLGSILAGIIFQIALGLGLDKIQAQMMDNQIGARKAFEKLGFKEEAILKESVMDLKGDKHDLVIMSNSVTELWKRMEDMIVYSEMRVIG